jgi:hypothetical protein
VVLSIEHCEVDKLADDPRPRPVRPPPQRAPELRRVRARPADPRSERTWAWLAHSKNNSTIHAPMARDDEARLLSEMMDTIEKATGTRPRGWMSWALNASFDIPELLAGLGVDCILDWCADDEPFPMEVAAGRMISVPYSIEVNGITLFVGHSCSGPDFGQILVDQYAEGATTGRVMAVVVRSVRRGTAVPDEVSRERSRVHHRPPRCRGANDRRDRRLVLCPCRLGAGLLTATTGRRGLRS